MPFLTTVTSQININYPIELELSVYEKTLGLNDDFNISCEVSRGDLPANVSCHNSSSLISFGGSCLFGATVMFGDRLKLNSLQLISSQKSFSFSFECTAQ